MAGFSISTIGRVWTRRAAADSRWAKVESLIRQMRDGGLYSAEFFERQRGIGPRAEQIAQTHKMFAARYCLKGPRKSLSSAAFVRNPGGEELNGQLELFGRA